jgi:hypothetical protein
MPTSEETEAMGGLTRLQPLDDALSRYEHSAGYVIERHKRSWSERDIPRGTAPVPLESWSVYRRAGAKTRPGVHFSRELTSERTLKDAVAWIEEAVDA